MPGGGAAVEDRLGVGPVVQVVGLLRVAGGDVVPVLRRDRGLQVEDALSAGRGVVEAGEFEHPLDVCDERLADRGEPLLAEVRLVGQRDARLLEEDEVALRVARVVVDEQLVEAAETAALQLADGLQEARDAVHAGRERQLVADRLHAESVDALLVQEAGEEVAELALLGALVGVLRALDDLAHRRLRLLGEDHERAPARLVGGDLGAVEPLAVHVPEQVVLRAGGGVEFVGADAGVERHAPSLRVRPSRGPATTAAGRTGRRARRERARRGWTRCRRGCRIRRTRTRC